MPPSADELERMLQEWRQALQEGYAPKALDRKLQEHIVSSGQRHHELEERVRDLELADNRRSAVSDYVKTGTGRHMIVDPVEHGYVAPIVPMAPAPPPPTPTKRGSISPWLHAAAKSPLAHWIGTVVIVLLSQLLIRCGFPPQSLPH